jgi:Domain of unknown function (DUF4184)
MPFTFAHPAAVLPLRRSRFLHTIPLVIGSLVPDVPYYFPTHLSRMFVDTHTLYGSFSVCLPWGMAMLILTLLLRYPLTALLSARVRWLCLHSVENFTERPFHWPVAFLSILVGSWTHIAWDSFTHTGGWVTTHVAAFSTPISILGWDTQIYHLLQYVSSAFGLGVLTLWFWGRLRAVPAEGNWEPPGARGRRVVLVLVGAAAVLIGVWRAVAIWQAGAGSYYHLADLLLTRTISWFAALYLAAGLLATARAPEPEPAR